MEHKPVQSSNVLSRAYDPATRRLEVTFKNGGTYAYENVPPEEFDKLDRAPSFGSHLHANIKGVFEHSKVG